MRVVGSPSSEIGGGGAKYAIDDAICYTLVVMGGTLGTGTFKPEKNLVFFSG